MKYITAFRMTAVLSAIIFFAANGSEYSEKDEKDWQALLATQRELQIKEDSKTPAVALGQVGKNRLIRNIEAKLLNARKEIELGNGLKAEGYIDVSDYQIHSMLLSGNNLLNQAESEIRELENKYQVSTIVLRNELNTLREELRSGKKREPASLVKFLTAIYNRLFSTNTPTQ